MSLLRTLVNNFEVWGNQQMDLTTGATRRSGMSASRSGPTMRQRESRHRRRRVSRAVPCCRGARNTWEDRECTDAGAMFRGVLTRAGAWAAGGFANRGGAVHRLYRRLGPVRGWAGNGRLRVGYHLRRLRCGHDVRPGSRAVPASVAGPLSIFRESIHDHDDQDEDLLQSRRLVCRLHRRMPASVRRTESGEPMVDSGDDALQRMAVRRIRLRPSELGAHGCSKCHCNCVCALLRRRPLRRHPRVDIDRRRDTHIRDARVVSSSALARVDAC